MKFNKKPTDLIGSHCKVYKRDDKGAKTDEIVIEGEYRGLVKELVKSQSTFGVVITSYDVASILTTINGVKEFKKVPMEVLEFPK